MVSAATHSEKLTGFILQCVCVYVCVAGCLECAQVSGCFFISVEGVANPSSTIQVHKILHVQMLLRLFQDQIFEKLHIFQT